MTAKAKADINDKNLSPEKLVALYGTHVINDCYLGGKMSYNMVMDITQFSKTVDIGATAKAAYKAIVGSIEGGANTDIENSIKKGEIKVTISVKTFGGENGPVIKSSSSYDEATGKPLNSISDDIGDWEKTINPDNYTLCDFQTVKNSSQSDQLTWFCIADFCDDPDRKKAIENYIYTTYPTEYKLPAVERYKFRVKVPTFGDETKIYYGTPPTQVKQVLGEDGKVVAEICKEWLQGKNEKSRLTVMYPLRSDLLDVDYTKGKMWDGTDVSCVFDTENERKTIFKYKSNSITPTEYLVLNLRDNTISPVASAVDKERTVLNTRDLYLTVNHKKNGNIVSVNYPVVKIGTRVWTRQDVDIPCYQDGGYNTTTASHTHTIKNGYAGSINITYYAHQNMKRSDFTPKGWRVPSDRMDWGVIWYMGYQYYPAFDKIEDVCDRVYVTVTGGYDVSGFSNMRWGC